MEQALVSNIWRSLTYTSTMPSIFALLLKLDCLNALKFQPFCHFQPSRTKTAGRLDNPILIREQKYLAWLMCRSNYAKYYLLELVPFLRTTSIQQQGQDYLKEVRKITKGHAIYPSWKRKAVVPHLAPAAMHTAYSVLKKSSWLTLWFLCLVVYRLNGFVDFAKLWRTKTLIWSSSYVRRLSEDTVRGQ